MSVKLSDYCKNNGISYITGYRWFKENKLPVPAYQTETGTILVDDAPLAYDLQQNNDAMSLFLKKTVEFSKNNSTIEDFAAYILSNFSIKINNVESIKQKQIDIQEPSKYEDEIIEQNYLSKNQQIGKNYFISQIVDVPNNISINSLVDSENSINFSSQTNDFTPSSNSEMTNSVFNNYFTRSLNTKSLSMSEKPKRGRPRKK